MAEAQPADLSWRAHGATPEWLDALATAFLALAFLCAAVMAVMLAARPQKMWIMDIVWPVTALYRGPVGLWGLWDMGTPPVSPAKRTEQQQRRKQEEKGPMKPFWQQVAVAVSHCGSRRISPPETWAKLL